MGIHITLTSNLHWPAQISGYSLDPQQGWAHLQSEQKMNTGVVLPQTVQPGGTACFFSFLAPSAERREGALMCSVQSRLCTAKASE